MLILLARVPPGPARVTCPDVENQPCIKSVRPTTTIVAAFAATSRRALLSQRIEHRNDLLRKAEEYIVAVAETMIDSELISVGVVDCGTALRKVNGYQFRNDHRF